MLLPRSISSAALMIAVATALVLPAQTALAASAAFPTGDASSVRMLAQGGSAQPAATSAAGEEDGSASSASSSDDDAAAGPADEPIEVVDPVEDDTLDQEIEVADPIDDGGSDAVAATPARTSGRWAVVAAPTAVRARLTSFDRAKVTWRAGARGAAASRFVVELRSGRTVLRSTTSPSARSAVFWNLAAGRRWALTVTATAAGGSKAASAPIGMRTPTASAAAKAAQRLAARAKAAARHAKAAGRV